jgi:DNA replicative helicase MCM subunit Mcm2 (Cdc46/Mcm family)
VSNEALKEFSASFQNLEDEINRNDAAESEVSRKTLSLSDMLVERFEKVLSEAKHDGNSYIVDVRRLPEDLRELVEKEYDLAKRIVFKIDEDAELRLTGCTPVRVKELTQADVGKLRQVSGVIIRFDEERRIDIIKDAWECDEGHVTTCIGPREATKCTFPTKTKSVRGKPLSCGATFVRQVYDQQKRTDLFAVRLEEQEDDPDLEDSAIDITFSGSELVRDVLETLRSNEKFVAVSGIVKLVGTRESGGMIMFIDAVNIEVIEQQYTSRYDELVRRPIAPEFMRAHVMKLVRSFCPHIAGRIDVKTGMMAAAVGATPKRIEAGSKLRGELNVLIMGSPGTGKTQFCKFMEKIRKSSVYVSGRQSSAIGLTAGVEWSETGIAGGSKRRQVYRGVYALAQNGIAIVDEIHKREKKDLEHLASVMDDNQEIIVAKQGMFKKLVISCGSVHAGNPRSNGGIYDKKIGLVEQMDQAFWLVSRYDLIFVMTREDQKDTGASIRHAVAQMYRTARTIGSGQEVIEERPLTPEEERMVLTAEYYPVDYLAAEVEYLRELPPPTLEVGSRAWDLMIEFWEKFSNMKVPDNLADVFDNRKMNSIHRVAECIARLYRSKIVETIHMEEAISLFHSGITHIINNPAPELGFVRFAQWLIRQAINECYLCRGKGCDMCNGIGGSYIPITLDDLADYPYQEEMRRSWDYLKSVGAVVQMPESLGGMSYRITSIAKDMAAGEWREREDKDIAREAMGLIA